MLDMDKKISIRNLCDYPLYFHRVNGSGDVTLPAKTTIRLDIAEVVSQVQNGNIMFTGDDTFGSHAMIYIEDKEVRVELEFETDDKPQEVISDEKVKAAFAEKTKAKFKKAIEDIAKTYGEKLSLIKCVKKLGLNEYDKIKFIEEYTGMKVED